MWATLGVASLITKSLELLHGTEGSSRCESWQHRLDL
jgi:hypothetical protein